MTVQFRVSCRREIANCSMFSMFVQVMKIKSFKLSDGLSIFDSKYEKNGIYMYQKTTVTQRV